MAKGIFQRLSNLKRRLRKLRRGVRSDARSVRASNSNAAKKASIIVARNIPEAADDNQQPISRELLERSADAQDLSAFFRKLPLELRQLIYAEIWNQYLGSHDNDHSHQKQQHQDGTPALGRLRLHIHSSEPNSGPLTHTACVVDADTPNSGDPKGIQPWPDWPGTEQNMPLPPQWVWSAWCLRLRWGRHWQCQEKVMMRWNHSTGETDCVGKEPSPFMPLFLSCKRMYLESMTSLFSSITPVFTSSSDATRFFLHRPNPFLDEIRSLELSFCNPNDQMYLFKSIAFASSAPDRPNRLSVFGDQPWRELLGAVRTQATALRHLRITVGGRTAMTEERLLDLLAEDDGEQCSWALPGKLVIDSTLHDVRYTRESGGEVVQSVVRA